VVAGVAKKANEEIASWAKRLDWEGIGTLSEAWSRGSYKLGPGPPIGTQPRKKVKTRRVRGRATRLGGGAGTKKEVHHLSLPKKQALFKRNIPKKHAVCEKNPKKNKDII